MIEHRAATPRPPFDETLLPGPIEITGYKLLAPDYLRVDQFSVYGTQCNVDHDVPLPNSETDHDRYLSPRQEQAIILGAFGFTNNKCGQFIHRTEGTVKTTKRNAMGKLHITGPTASEVSVRKLVEFGMFTFEGTVDMPFEVHPLTATIFNGLSRGKSMRQMVTEGLWSPEGEKLNIDHLKNNMRRFRRLCKSPGASLALGVLLGLGAGFIEVDKPA